MIIQNRTISIDLTCTQVQTTETYAGFSKGVGRKFENNEDQKKGLHSDLARFSAQI